MIRLPFRLEVWRRVERRLYVDRREIQAILLHYGTLRVIALEQQEPAVVLDFLRDTERAFLNVSAEPWDPE